MTALQIVATGEIVEQVVAGARRARSGERPRRLSNVVFMGMGEPLANYDRLWSAITRLHEDIGLSARHVRHCVGGGTGKSTGRSRG